MSSLPIGITTISVGYASAHSIETKLKACSDAGFMGVEVFFDDLVILPRTTAGPDDSRVSARQTARLVHSLCRKLGLRIINLQPFRNYEGLVDRAQHRRKIEELKEYLALCKILGTDQIGVPSTFIADPAITTGDRDVIVQDLREMADLGAQQSPPIRFAYEAMAWGPHVSSWQDAWDIVQKVDRPNFGILLDTFQMLAKAWADPEVRGGERPFAAKALREDLLELVSSVKVEKIFLIQAADGVRLDKPLSNYHPWRDPAQHPLLTWSRKARLFPLEVDKGAYLPVTEVLEACILRLGYRGWISMEIFNDRLSNQDPSAPVLQASRGMQAWSKCVKALQNAVLSSQQRQRVAVAPLKNLLSDEGLLEHEGGLSILDCRRRAEKPEVLVLEKGITVTSL